MRKKQEAGAARRRRERALRKNGALLESKYRSCVRVSHHRRHRRRRPPPSPDAESDVRGIPEARRADMTRETIIQKHRRRQIYCSLIQTSTLRRERVVVAYCRYETVERCIRRTVHPLLPIRSSDTLERFRSLFSLVAQ